MECRCYRGGEGRTKLKVMKTRASDYVFLSAVTVLTVGICFLKSVEFSEVIAFCGDIF